MLENNFRAYLELKLQLGKVSPQVEQVLLVVYCQILQVQKKGTGDQQVQSDKANKIHQNMVTISNIFIS